MNHEAHPAYLQMSEFLLAQTYQAVTRLERALLSQALWFQNKGLSLSTIPLRRNHTAFNPLPSEYRVKNVDFHRQTPFFDASSVQAGFDESILKNNLSPASYSMASTLEESGNNSEHSETNEFPQILEKLEDDMVKLEGCYSENNQPEKLMKNSKKIKKEICAGSPKLNKNEQKQSKSQRRHRWTPEEDTQLASLFEIHGPKWTQIAAMMTGKTSKQIRDRYMNILRPDINHEDWTEEEERLFSFLYGRFGNKWCKIAAHLPGRSENQVKNKFYSQKRKE